MKVKGDIKMLNKMKSALGRKTIIVIFLMALTIECSSQIIEDGTYVQQVWSREYNGSDNSRDYIKSMVVDAAGNVYVTGSTMETGRYNDYTTIKYNSAGVRLWVAHYNNNSGDFANSVAVDGFGNVYVTGYSYGDNAADYLTIKYNSSGAEQWVKRYDGTGNDVDYAQSLAIDEDGNVYVTGSSMDASGNEDYVTIKYSSLGNTVWLKRYNGAGNLYERTNSMVVDGNGNVYVAGNTKRSETDDDYLIIKYNPSGNEEWVRTYDGLGHGFDHVQKIVLGLNNSIYLTGNSEGNGTGKDFLTIRYNAEGTMQWARRYNGPANNIDWVKTLVVDADGNTYVTGYSMSNVSNYDYATIKYNSSGIQQWVKRLDGGINSVDYARDMALDESGNIYVTGAFLKTYSDYQIATIKYSPSGAQKWLKLYNNPAGKVSTGSSIAVDGSGNVFVAASSDVSGADIGNYANYLVVKYTQSRYVIVNRVDIPNTFSLSQNYPNPFNPVTKITFSIPDNSYTKLTVYDISGKQVAELINSELEAGSYNIDFDASHLSSGTYFYRMESGSFAEVKKMVLVK